MDSNVGNNSNQTLREMPLLDMFESYPGFDLMQHVEFGFCGFVSDLISMHLSRKKMQLNIDTSSIKISPTGQWYIGTSTVIASETNASSHSPYLAPEVANNANARNISLSADSFSLGMVMYEIYHTMTRRRLDTAELVAVKTTILASGTDSLDLSFIPTETMRTIVRGMLQKELTKRYSLLNVLNALYGRLSFADLMKCRHTAILDRRQFVREFAYEASKQLLQAFQQGQKISITDESFVFVKKNTSTNSSAAAAGTATSFSSNELRLLYPYTESASKLEPLDLLKNALRQVFKMVHRLLTSAGDDKIGNKGADARYPVPDDVWSKLLSEIQCTDMRQLIGRFCFLSRVGLSSWPACVHELDPHLLAGAVVNKENGHIYWLQQQQHPLPQTVVAKIHGEEAWVLIARKPDAETLHRETTLNDIMQPYRCPHLLMQIYRGAFLLQHNTTPESETVRKGPSVKRSPPAVTTFTSPPATALSTPVSTAAASAVATAEMTAEFFHASVYQHGTPLAQHRDYDVSTLRLFDCQVVEGMRTLFCAGRTLSEISEHTVFICTNSKGQKVAKLSGLEHCCPFSMLNAQRNCFMAAEVVYSLCSGGQRLPWLGAHRQIAGEDWRIADQLVTSAISLLLEGIFTGAHIDAFLRDYGGRTMGKLPVERLRQCQVMATPSTIEKSAMVGTPPCSASCDDLAAILGMPSHIAESSSPEAVKQGMDALTGSAPSSPIPSRSSDDSLEERVVAEAAASTVIDEEGEMGLGFDLEELVKEAVLKNEGVAQQQEDNNRRSGTKRQRTPDAATSSATTRPRKQQRIATATTPLVR